MQSRLSAILMYHSLDGTGSPVSIEPDMFRAHMRILAAQGIPVVPLGDAVRTPGSVAITFDDAFANFSEVALPELERHRFPATVFAVSGYCGRRNDWPSQPAGIPVLPLMSWSALEDAAQSGIEIGAHTVTHPRLDRLAPEAAAREIRESAREIEDKIGRPVHSFAYPYGAGPADASRTVAERFRNAVSTELDYARDTSDPHWLPRIDAFYFQSEGLFGRLFTPAGSLYLTARRGLRRLRQAGRLGA